jgi:hypothetical protein
MSVAENGRRPKENGMGMDKLDDVQMLRESAWTALPDLVLTLIPTGILLISGNADGTSL